MKIGVFSEETRKKYGTIYTPGFVVDKTLDLAWKYHKITKETTFMDPAAGDGNFLVAVWARLMKDLEKEIKDPIERSFHILTKQIHGIEILKPMWIACKLRLLKLHFDLIKEAKRTDYPIDLFDLIDVKWGNTIVVEEDTEQDWYKNRPEYEGGIIKEQ